MPHAFFQHVSTRHRDCPWQVQTALCPGADHLLQHVSTVIVFCSVKVASIGKMLSLPTATEFKTGVTLSRKSLNMTQFHLAVSGTCGFSSVASSARSWRACEPALGACKTSTILARPGPLDFQLNARTGHALDRTTLHNQAPHSLHQCLGTEKGGQVLCSACGNQACLSSFVTTHACELSTQPASSTQNKAACMEASFLACISLHRSCRVSKYFACS